MTRRFAEFFRFKSEGIMRQSVAIAVSESMIVSKRSRVCTSSFTRQLRILCIAAICTFLFASVSGIRANAQMPPSSSPTQGTAQSQPDDGSNTSADSSEMSESGRDSETRSANLTPRTALSADQITNILQQSPDLVMELKSQLADRMQQQGVQIDANDISDQTLYNQIATNADLRANITTVLQARGYVSDNDLQPIGPGAASKEGTDPQSLAQQDPLMADSAKGTGIDAASGGNGEASNIEGNRSSATTAESLHANRNGQSQNVIPRRLEKT